MTRWIEVADGIFQGRYQPYDVNVTVVRGAGGLLVVDTRSSHREADEIRRDLAELGSQPVRWVVNTHAHFDHSFGNYRFGPDSDLGLPIYGHERVPAHLRDYETPKLARFVKHDEERAAEWREVVITPPTELVADRAEIDLGDRSVHLVHLGRGHTDNDLLLHVPAVDTWLVGDVIEESGPPMYAADSFPLDWPDTIGALTGHLGTSTVVVPGHGTAVDHRFVAGQLADLRTVADLIRQLQAAGVPVEDALAAGGDRWPFPVDGLVEAVGRGYQHAAESAQDDRAIIR